MSSFVKYINGDPVYTDPNDATEAYNYMSAFSAMELLLLTLKQV
ncbi:MAG: hypothetical protein CM1200mP10_28380 [Candidatus Neomarinimicrobiota bacterium]|nr:MAG: hypothetical protein CM1200mP10_28380 [Candidatus Neomarinimicrobiota bacterium]